MRLLSLSLLFIGIFSILQIHAQDSVRISPKYIEQVGSKSKNIEDKLDRKTGKLLAKWQQREARIWSKLHRTDSSKASTLATESAARYNQLKEKLARGGSLQQYIPNLDSGISSLKFLQSNSQLIGSAKGVTEKLNSAMKGLKGMEGQFQKAEDVQQFLKERRAWLKEQIGQLGFVKQFKQLNKQAYYYSAQVNEYKSMLKDHKKAERKALALLSKTKLFKDFMRKNSQLSSLFRPPFDPADPYSIASMAGLQTRAQVNGLIQQQIAAGGPGASSTMQANMQEAQSKMNELKNKILKAGGSSSDAELPEGFKPNNQKTKSFWKRIELGTNVQSVRASGYWPSTSDLGLSIGYKLSDNGIIGIGASYKLGWGRDIRHIHVTHQGVGLRSFVDWKLKGSFWLSGGYEMNYRSEFKNIDALKDLNAWQASGLIGVSKVISLKTKLLKKTKLMLLWDFLSYRQVPRTQAVLFRIGYTF